jgi:hypothetical protein
MGALARFAPCVVAWLVGTQPAQAQSTVEPAGESTANFRLHWLFGDDDVLHPPDAARPPSPASAIGDRTGYDPLLRELGGRFTGRENRAELRVLLAAPSFVPGLATRAALALGADLEAATQARNDVSPFADLGSYVELEQQLSPMSQLALRLYPLDGDEQRVGELDALAFGGAVGAKRDSPYRSATKLPRAARFSLKAAGISAFLGLKTAPFVEALPIGVAVEETSYGVFAGTLSDIGAHIRLGVSGGHFEHGARRRAASHSVQRSGWVCANHRDLRSWNRRPAPRTLIWRSHPRGSLSVRSGWRSPCDADVSSGPPSCGWRLRVAELCPARLASRGSS